MVLSLSRIVCDDDDDNNDDGCLQVWTRGPGTSTSGVLNYTSDSLIDNLTYTNTTFTAANTTAAAALETESEAVNVTQAVVMTPVTTETTESTGGVAGVQARDTSSLLDLPSSAYYSSALDQAGLWGSSAVFSPAYQQEPVK